MACYNLIDQGLVPASEVRHPSPHPLTRTSEAKGTSNFMILVRLLNLRFLTEHAAMNDRNLKFAALAGWSAAPTVMAAAARRHRECAPARLSCSRSGAQARGAAQW